MRLLRIFLFAVFLAVVSRPVPGAPASLADDLFSFLKIDRDRQAGLKSGKILSCEVNESSDKDLGIGLVMFVPAPVEKLVEYVRAEKLLGQDPEIVAYGEWTGPEALKEIRVGTAQAGELVEVEPGTDFNLDTAEIKGFNDIARNVRDRSGWPAAAGDWYRQILLARLNAYRKGGLAAVAPYDRGDGDFARPADELTAELKNSPLLDRHFPGLQRALLNYPQDQPTGIVHRFYWFSQTIEKQPTFILSHRMKLVTPDGAYLAERQFYVGRCYNSLQILAGCVPVEGGTLVFYSNHTCTDQVAGFGGGLKRSIGRSQMRDDVIKGFEEIRAALK